MVGSARTLHRREVARNLELNLLKPLREHHWTKLFMVMDLRVHWQGIDLPSLHTSDYDISLKQLNPDEVEWGDGPFAKNLQNHHNKDPRCGYDKFATCLDMVLEYEKKNDIKFDWIVKSRPDLLVLAPLPPVALWPVNKIWVNPYYEYTNDAESLSNLNIDLLPYKIRTSAHPDAEQHFGISDIVAIVPRSLGNVYFYDILRSDLPNEVCGVRRNDCECRIKSALVQGKVQYEFAPIIVRLRRDYELCVRSNRLNRFNTVC
jgi:hypothetical protein